AERLAGVDGLSDSVAVCREVGGHGAAGRVVVLDEQEARAARCDDGRPSAAHSRGAAVAPDRDAVAPATTTCSCGSGAAAGSSTTILRPPSGLGAADTEPPIASLIPRTIARPSPRPGREPELVDGSGWNFVKSRSRA